jgi:hypothetical protein
MIVTKLMGGLGNQMFQYAAAKNLALKNNQELYVDLNFLLDRTPRAGFTFRDFDLPVFNITYKIADAALLENFFGAGSGIKNAFIKGLNKLQNKKFNYYCEPYFQVNPDFFHLSGNCYLEGYFQSEKYFSEHAAIIKKEFTPKSPSAEKVKQLLEKITQDSAAVCLNIRRGDFVSNPAMAAEHGVLGLDYYYSAVQEISKKVQGITLYVFSDDVEWCLANLKFDFPAFFVDHSYAGEKYSSYLLLMQHCKHFIIPNSTFGWWAAWLSDHAEKTVIAPKKWFNTSQKDTKDILPDSWIKL